MSIQSIASALKGRMSSDHAMVCCPVHNDRTPSLKITEFDGDIRVHCFAGCDWRLVKAELALRGLLPTYYGFKPSVSCETASERKERRHRDEQADLRNAKWCQSIWNASQNVKNSLVVSYLASRRIDITPPSIRYHSGLKHSMSGKYIPAMVAAVTRHPNDELIGIHRTYLHPNGRGKAKVFNAKMMAGKCKGGAVQLAPYTSKIALTEGIETGLSVQQSTNIPTWACLSTSGLTAVVIPESVAEILIFADGDIPGNKAAQTTATRLAMQGKDVRIILAPQGMDWNDELMNSSVSLETANA
tara:strand:- start:1255 stop:2157 length:903 start_codon:yes stop_codon:yes gene_type:complete